MPTPATSPASLPITGLPGASIAPASRWVPSFTMIETSSRPIRPAAPDTIRLAMAFLHDHPDPVRLARPTGFACGLSARAFCRRGRGGWCCRCCGFGLLAVRRVPMLLAQAGAKTRLAALFFGADLIARLRHFAGLPEAVMFAAIAPRYHFMIAVGGLAGFCVRHWSFCFIDPSSGLS